MDGLERGKEGYGHSAKPHWASVDRVELLEPQIFHYVVQRGKIRPPIPAISPSWPSLFCCFWASTNVMRLAGKIFQSLIGKDTSFAALSESQNNVPTALGTELETMATFVPLPPRCPFLQFLVSVNVISICLVSPTGIFLFLYPFPTHSISDIQMIPMASQPIDPLQTALLPIAASQCESVFYFCHITPLNPSYHFPLLLGEQTTLLP